MSFGSLTNTVVVSKSIQNPVMKFRNTSTMK